MLGSFRLVMTWLHTWFGLVFGFVLTVVFFFGSLSVFNREIDRWAIPETRFEPRETPSFDAVLRPILEGLEPEEEDLAEARKRVGSSLDSPLPPLYWSTWWSHRDPMLGFYAEFSVENPKDPHDHVHGHASVDPRNGKPLREGRLAIGSELFYPLHYSLTLHWLDLGIWIVGVASLLMLVALVSGVVIHKKIFREFFTFRPRKNGQRRILDLHNLTGVVALPFHFLFAFTGLLIFAGIYFPITETMFQRVHDHHEAVEDRASGRPHERSGVAAPLASVDAMVEEAKRRWAARGAQAEVGSISVNYVGDANSYVSIYPTRGARLAPGDQALYFAGPTGRFLGEDRAASAVGSVNEFLTGLHLMPFEHWLLRWLFVVGGLASCTCIATGLVFFVGKRKLKHAAQGVAGARWVDALAVTTVTGTLLATTSILVANRLLPLDLAGRGDWEVRVFWAAWLLSFAHAALRTAQVRTARFAPAWREQCCAVAALAVSAAALNWITTGDHLIRTIGDRYWPVAGFDLSLLVAAALAAFAAARLKRHEAETGTPAEEEPAAEAPTGEVAHG